MACGFDFDDSLFEDTKSKGKEGVHSPSEFEAKICEARWFESCQSDDLCVVKHRAELAYRERNYTKALSYYQTCLELISTRNQVVWKDATESLCRCQLAIGQLDEALLTADTLHEWAVTFEQKTASWLLLAKVHQNMENWEDEKKVMQVLTTMHTSNADFWRRLAELNLLLINHEEDTATACSPALHRRCSVCLAVHSGHLWKLSVQTRSFAIACACLQRARTLLQFSQQSVASFLAEQNQRNLDKLTNQIADLDLCDALKAQCAMHVYADLTQRKGRSPDDVALANLDITQVTSNFDKKYFAWIYEETT